MPAAHQQRMRRCLAASLLVVAGGLGACTSLGSGDESGKPATPPPAATAPAQRPPPMVAALPRPTRKPPAPDEAAVPPRETPAIDPQHVIGLKQGDAEEWLGEPTERKDAPPATIWRYVSRDCEVDIYFYLDLQQRIMRALHYEVRGNDSGRQRSERCFQQLVERREHDGGAVANPAR
jgi:hypothetical protein